MLRRIVGSRLAIAATSLAVGVSLASGVAWALQSPVDGSGVIHACYSPSNGNLHLNVTGSCPTTGQNTPITWNVKGPQGAPGPQGPPGPVAPCGGFPHAGVDWSLPGSSPGHGCNFAGAFLFGTDLAGANLTNADLSSAVLTSNGIPSADLAGAIFAGVDLSNAKAESGSNDFFSSAQLHAAFSLVGIDLTSEGYTPGTDFSGLNLTGAHLRNFDAVGAILTNANLTNADLFNATLNGALVNGVIWKNTTCPDGSNSDNDGFTCAGHGGGL
jgi:hypothetical protein